MNETVTLGGRRFEIRPLKLGQLRHLFDALDEMSGKAGGALIEAAAKVAAAGLTPANPDLTADAVLDLEATIEELNATVAAVLRVAGLTPAGEAPPVASPDEISGNSSAQFTAPSPPAAAIPTGSSTA